MASDVHPYAIVVGNPGRVVRLRFDEETIERLLAICWWDWPIDKITKHLSAIRGAHIHALEAAELDCDSALDATAKAG